MAVGDVNVEIAAGALTMAAQVDESRNITVTCSGHSAEIPADVFTVDAHGLLQEIMGASNDHFLARGIRFLSQRGRAEISLKGKIRTILLPNKLCRKLLKYAKKQKTASGEVFLTRNGTGISRKQIWAEMKALCKKAGVAASKVFPHNLRHLFARVFYSACRDVMKLADVLGHSSIETTRIYLVTTGIEHARTLEELRLIS